MLIGAAVALSTIVLFWGLGLISQGQSDLGIGISESNAQIGEQFEVEDIFWNSSGGIIFYIRNFGDQPLTIDRLIIDGSDESDSIDPAVITSRNVEAIFSSFPWSSADTYTIVIGSNRGTYQEIEVSTP